MIASALAVIALLICLREMRESASAGLSRFLSAYGQSVNRLDATNEAVRLTPSDPEAHYARAVVLARVGKPAEAVVELERAVAQRPRDYVLWLELGSARDNAGRQERALAAYRQATSRAPYYAQPRWELGNLLFRSGLQDEAFAELRHAAASDPTLLPAVIDLAWTATNGSTQAVEQAIQPKTNEGRIALARFFAKRGKTTEALALFRAAGGPSKEDRRALISDLVAAQRFNEAYEAWSSTGGNEPEKGKGGGIAALTDGGFENSSSLDDPGFGWQATRNIRAVRPSLDPSGPHSGARSLRVEWNGESDPATAVVSQLVLVEPQAHYRLSFAARTEELVSGGAPALAVIDAGKDGRPLAQALSLPQGTSGWHDYTLEFATGSTTNAIRISIQRLNCNGNAPCPAFGRAWFDDFSLQKR